MAARKIHCLRPTSSPKEFGLSISKCHITDLLLVFDITSCPPCFPCPNLVQKPKYGSSVYKEEDRCRRALWAWPWPVDLEGKVEGSFLLHNTENHSQEGNVT